MNRTSYDQLLTAAKREAAAIIAEHNTPAGVYHGLTILATRVAAITRDYHLLNLLGVDDVAHALDIAPISARQLLARRHASDGIGRQVGKNTWIVDVDELPALEQDRRKKENH